MIATILPADSLIQPNRLRGALTYATGESDRPGTLGGKFQPAAQDARPTPKEEVTGIPLPAFCEGCPN